MSVIPTDLTRSLGIHISKICPFSIANNNLENHCAHYVSHILGYQFPGATCKNATWADKQSVGQGATIRVNDLFNSILVTDKLANKPAVLTECLIFVTLGTNMKTIANRLMMGTHPKKHVGILYNGNIWSYSNSQNKVVADSLFMFKNKFSRAYQTSGASVEFYYGDFI